MNSRLEELERQHGLIREHLHWIERQIAAESGRADVTPPAGLQFEPEAVDPGSDPASPSWPGIGEAVVQPPFMPDPDVKSLQSEVRSGCLLYAAVLFGGLALLVGLIYWRY